MADLNSLGGIHYEIMRRCYNENFKLYPIYGEKGITVCEEWKDRETFKEWARNNGWEKGLRLQRKDKSGNYEPENCYFSNERKMKGNMSNLKRARINKAKKIEILGVKKMSEHRLYRTYISMHSRCELETNTAYKYYGERGISVCDKWSGKEGFYNFVKWAEENGWQENLTLDRINFNGNYEPSNCRWADNETQLNNKRNNIRVMYNGEFVTAKYVMQKERISLQEIRKRYIVEKLENL